jgi:dTDP-4-dehydrorhamnose reductase
MKILVTGANGQVGHEMVKKSPSTDFSVHGFDRLSLDITDRENITKVVKDINPALIINCAAYTAVDKAEGDQKKAFATNQSGPAFLAEECQRLHIPLIHLSTDYVFNGKARLPYKETDHVSPLGIYGKSKEAGEKEVRSILDRHIILRTSWLYGSHGNNFVKTMLRLGQEREELRVVNDQWGCPTFAGDIANALLVIAGKILTGTFTDWGTYHCCGSTALTWYDFASHIFSMAKNSDDLSLKNIIPIPTEQFPTPAPRPAYSILDCRKLYSTFGVLLPELTDSLKNFFNDIENSGESL